MSRLIESGSAFRAMVPQPVQNVRPSGVFAKVNRVRFSLQGNKFGAGDGDGNVALWQAANATSPFFVSTILNIQGE